MATRALTRRALQHRAASAGARHRARGQSMLEFVIVVPVFLFLVLGIVQMVLLFRAKSTLDYAALEAARAGATARGQMPALRRGLQRGLMPLFATDATPQGLAEAFARAGADIDGHACIEIVSPTRRAWMQHRVRDHLGQWVIPNDSLAFRSHVVDPRPGEQPSGVNVQDANVLKLRVVYDYPLVVPFVDRVLRGASTLVRGGDDTEMTLDAGEDHFRIPLEAQAIVRMQSPLSAAAVPFLLECPDCPRACDAG